MDRKRPWYPTKEAWAQAQVAECDAAIKTLRANSIPGANWRAVQAKVRALDTWRQRREKFERLARRYAPAAPHPCRARVAG